LLNSNLTGTTSAVNGGRVVTYGNNRAEVDVALVVMGEVVA
jgi:hypothetical protein